MNADWMDVVAVAALGCFLAALGCFLAAVLLLGLCCFAGAVERRGVVPEDGEAKK